MLHKPLIKLAILLALVLTIGVVLRIFGIHTSFNILPKFLSGEKVLFFKRWIWAGSLKSRPTYRLWGSLPPLIEHGLYVTDKRVLHVFHFCRLLKQEHSQWFEEKGKLGDNDFVKEIRIGNSWLFGPYLEVISENPVKRWYRSPLFRMRLFMRNPESAHKVIAEEMAKIPKTVSNDD